MEDKGGKIVLYITKSDYDKILLHAKQMLPKEACGLMAGDWSGGDKWVKQIYILHNIEDSNSRFAMDPKEQIEAQKDAREKGFRILGSFHSHPNTPAFPSKRDTELAYDLQADYCILSLMDLKKPVLKAFMFEEKKKIIENPIVYME